MNEIPVDLEACVVQLIHLARHKFSEYFFLVYSLAIFLIINFYILFLFSFHSFRLVFGIDFVFGSFPHVRHLIFLCD